MSIVDSLKAWPKAKKITVAVIAAVAVAAVGVTIFLINRNNILATTMRLLKVEGTVNIEDASGAVKPVIDNIPMLIVVLVLTIPVAMLTLRLAERAMKRPAATLN
jgi:hypothetical protein